MAVQMLVDIRVSRSTVRGKVEGTMRAEAARESLKSKGIRLTRQRQLLLD